MATMFIQLVECVATAVRISTPRALTLFRLTEAVFEAHNFPSAPTPRGRRREIPRNFSDSCFVLLN
jgi:hypothetical protein